MEPEIVAEPTVANATTTKTIWRYDTPRRSDSISDRLMSLFRSQNNVAVGGNEPSVINLGAKSVYSSGDDKGLADEEGDLSPNSPPSPEPGASPFPSEQRSFLETVLQWREAPPVPQTVSLLVGEHESLDTNEVGSFATGPATVSTTAASGTSLSADFVVGKLRQTAMRLLRSVDEVGPIALYIRSVTGEEFDVTIPRCPVSEVGAFLCNNLWSKTRSQKRATLLSFSLDRFIQQLHIKGNSPLSTAVQSQHFSGSEQDPSSMPTGNVSSPADRKLSSSSGGVASSQLPSGSAPPVDPNVQSSLTRIPEVLASCKRMSSFTVEGQQLVSIEEICRAQMLEELRVSHCELRDVPAQLFVSCPRLRFLDLSHNQLTGITATRAAERLQFFNLSHNLFTAVPPSLCSITTLTDLDLSYNRLSTLPAEMHNLVTLFRLNLEGNGLITPSIALIRGVMGTIDAVAQFPQLGSLNLARNKITEFPTAMESLVSLAELNVSDNRLTRIPLSLTQIPALVTLDLSGNSFGPDLPSELTQMPVLRILRIARNKLRSLPASLTLLKSLVELDVSFNRLRNIDPEVMCGLTRVAKLDASHNKLESLDFVVELAGLQTLELTHNLIRRLPEDIHMLEALKTVNLSHNRLTLLPPSFDRLYRLEWVDLSFNSLERLDPSWNASSFPHLRVILLEGNHKAVMGIHFSFSTLRKLTCLSLLGMMINSESLVISNPSRFDLSNVIYVTTRVQHPLLISAFFGLAMCPEYSQECMQQGVEMMANLCSVREQPSKSLTVQDVWPPVDIYLPDTARYLALRCMMNLTHKMEASLARWHFYVHGIPAVLMDIINRHPDVRFKLLCIRLLGNLALHPQVKSQIFYEKSDIVTYLEDLARTTHSDSIKRFCNRTFAIFGICQHFHTSLVNTSLVKHSGVRILSLDGGGTRSLSTLTILCKIRDMTGKRIEEMFDLIVGTSAGALIACAMLVGRSLEECADMYLEKGHYCFTPQDEVKEETPAPETLTTWGGKIRPMLNLATRRAMYKCKSYEKELKRFYGTNNTMIGSAESELSPKVCAVTTLTSVKPAVPYLCRNYDYPPNRQSRHDGDLTWKVWEVMRATSAAPSYFDPFDREGKQFMDGGVVANNPSGIAFHEARKIWGPNMPISLFLSVGTGTDFTTAVPKDRGVMETFEQLADAALSTQRVHEMMQDMLGPNIPYFRLQPVGSAMGCRMDEVRKGELQKVQADTRVWIEQNVDAFEKIRDILLEKNKADEPKSGQVVWHGDGSSVSSSDE